MEKENEKILGALENSADGVYIEQEPDTTEGFYEIEVNTSMKEAIDNALDKRGAKEESTEDSEKEDKVLKTALEIAMEKTDHLVEDLENNKFKDKSNLKTALEVAMEKTDHLVEDDSSEKDPEDSSEKVQEEIDDSETPEPEKKEEEEIEHEKDIEELKEEKDELENKSESGEIDYEKEISDFEESFDVPYTDENMKSRSFGILRTWDRWKSKLSEKANYSKIDKASKKIEGLEGQYDEITEKMLQISKDIDSIKENYKDKISEVEDSEILELIEKSQKEKISEKKKEILDLSADRDEIRDEVLGLKIELRDATDKIDEIESNHVDLINSQINSVLDNSYYGELADDAESKKEEIIKLKRRLDMVNDRMKNLEMILENPDMLSKEALKILKEKYKRSSKKAIVISGAINRKNKESNKSYKAAYKIINKINKLQELKK